jgi:hypothetical protein
VQLSLFCDCPFQPLDKRQKAVVMAVVVVYLFPKKLRGEITQVNKTVNNYSKEYL